MHQRLASCQQEIFRRKCRFLYDLLTISQRNKLTTNEMISVVVVVIFCITTMASSAPSDVRPVVNNEAAPLSRQVQENVEPGKFTTSVNISSQITNDDKLKYKRMFQARHSGFQSGYLPVSPFALPATYPTVPYGFNYFPGRRFPTYYPAFYQVKPDKYGFAGNHETKTDNEDFEDESLSESESQDDLRAGSTSASNSTTPSSPTNPMAPFLNTLITINNMKILKLLLANKAMLILG